MDRERRLPRELRVQLPAPACRHPQRARHQWHHLQALGAALGIKATQIQIARLGIDMPIVEGDGIDAPLGKAAHFPGTAWPDGASNIYLYAHARDEMFIGLWQAKPGDEVVLQLVDDTQRTYVVSQILPKVAWNAIQYLDPTPTEQLTLQTCTSDQPTSPRFIVIAVPKG